MVSTHPYSAGTNAVIENTAHIYNYSYENSTWKDLATSIKGYTITYDAIGNPLNWYTGATFTWENGRQLKSVNKNGYGTYQHLHGGSLIDWIYGIGPAGYCKTPTYGDKLMSLNKYWDRESWR